MKTPASSQTASPVPPAETPVPAGQALRTGARGAVRYWPILLIFFAVNACAAAAWTVPLRAALAPVWDRPGVWGPDGGLPIASLVEHMLSVSRVADVTVAEAPEDLAPETTLATLAVLGGLIVAVAAAALLPGGAILIYREGLPSFSFRRFIWGTAHWSVPFLALWLLEAVVTALAWALGFFLLLFGLAAGAGACALVPGLIIVLGVPFLFGMLAEYARVASVADDRRNPFAMLARAWRMVWARPWAYAGIYALGPVLALALLALYGYVLSPVTALAALPVMIVAQQLVVFLRLLARLWRLASETALIPSPATSR
jgi:hypothetical protein